MLDILLNTLVSTLQVFDISSLFNVGCTKNIKDVSPNNLAFFNGFVGTNVVFSNAFSLYTSEQLPEKQGTPSFDIASIIESLVQPLGSCSGFMVI